MAKYSKDGQQLWKRFTFKIFAPQTDKPIVRAFVAQAGQGFTKKFMADFIAAAALEIQDAFPTHQYKLIPRSDNEFTFVPTGVRVAPQPTASAQTA